MSNELSHHGIKGMRWGVRRYQNSDGSLTPQGRLRYHYSTGAKKNEEWAWKTARSLGSMSDDEYRKRYEAKWSDMP